MKITSLTIVNGGISSQPHPAGLQACTMEDMGPVVLLAGPNGGGKTRILKTVAGMTVFKMTADDTGRRKSENATILETIEHQTHALKEWLKDPNKKYDAHNLQNNLKNNRDAYAQIQHEIHLSDSLRTDNETKKPVIVNYRIRDIQLEDSRNALVAQQRTARKRIAASFNTSGLGEGLKAIHALLEQEVYAHSPAYLIEEEQREIIKVDCERLRTLFKDILGTELRHDFEQGPILFGRPIMEAELSEGQMVLLKVIISLFFQDGSADDLIILLDEPETHLHPFAVTQMIDNIRAACPNAQLWIATHSLHVLAHFPDTDIWFVKDGLVKNAGKHSVEVLHSLTGDDEGLEKLSRLLALPAEYTALKFAAECLSPPGVADTAAGDPQTTQIQQILSTMIVDDRPIRLLDIGMGKGRLLNELAAHHGQDLRTKIDYFGLNIQASAEDTDACQTKLRTHFADADRRYLDSPQKLKETLDPGSVDLAVMCNVLHEIDPTKWLHVFGKDGYLAERMRPDGFLLIVEDELLKVGERAHAFDFLVLTRNEILTLFGGSRDDANLVTIAHSEPRYRDRLKAHLVPAGLLAKVDRARVDAAIKELKTHAMEEIDGIKQKNSAQTDAKHYAFWTHQLANATLALRG
jgi:predicted ATPase